MPDIVTLETPLDDKKCGGLSARVAAPSYRLPNQEFSPGVSDRFDGSPTKQAPQPQLTNQR